MPKGLRDAMAVGNRWQDILGSQFVTGRTGNEILARTRDDKVEPVSDETRFRKGDQVAVLIMNERLEEAKAFLARFGITPEGEEPGEEAATDS